MRRYWGLPDFQLFSYAIFLISCNFADAPPVERFIFSLSHDIGLGEPDIVIIPRKQKKCNALLIGYMAVDKFPADNHNFLEIFAFLKVTAVGVASPIV